MERSNKQTNKHYSPRITASSVWPEDAAAEILPGVCCTPITILVIAVVTVIIQQLEG